jgi:Na+-translocating ferredoxin:NAD+ oxidoreductase RnfC subunit
MKLSDKILNAGVVGAGGAGFPTHIKANSEVEIVLANGAECEPLLHKDYEIMVNRPMEIVEGMKLMMESTKSQKGYFGIKAKNAGAIDAIEPYLEGTGIEMSLLGDFYPSGDEYELVYHATKRLMPPHGIPLDVGCVVNNVESFYNVYNAANDIPVTEKFVCVAGMVKKPSTFFTPIGTSYKDLIEHAGGTTINDYAIFVSGILMGSLTFDESEVVTKTTAGIIILPRDHYLVKRQERPINDMNRIGKSACDQCSYCTEFCPRYLLGYDVQPHKVMRTLVFTTSGKELWNQYADLCCSCGLCSLYACPEDLYPREACDQSKAEMRKAGERYEQPKPVKVHPIKDGRRVPLKQLLKRIDLYEYDAKTPFTESSPNPDKVKVLLKQHVGKTAKSKVKVNQEVKKGELIGQISEGEIGSNIHSPISGIVTHVSDEYVRINAF